MRVVVVARREVSSNVIVVSFSLVDEIHIHGCQQKAGRKKCRKNTNRRSSGIRYFFFRFSLSLSLAFKELHVTSSCCVGSQPTNTHTKRETNRDPHTRWQRKIFQQKSNCVRRRERERTMQRVRALRLPKKIPIEDRPEIPKQTICLEDT